MLLRRRVAYCVSWLDELRLDLRITGIGVLFEDWQLTGSTPTLVTLFEHVLDSNRISTLILTKCYAIFESLLFTFSLDLGHTILNCWL